MTPYEDHPHTKFGIDEVYVFENFSKELLNKYHRRSTLCFDGEDAIVKKHLTHDMILLFRKRPPTSSMIYRFLEFLNGYPKKELFLKSNSIDKEEELYAAVMLKKFALMTSSSLAKELYTPK